MDGRYENRIEAGEPRQSDSTERALIRELVLTLTALGNYLGAAQHSGPQERGPQDALRRVALERALQQFGHASSIVRRLQYVLRPLCEAPHGTHTELSQVPKRTELAQAACNSSGNGYSRPVDGG